MKFWLASPLTQNFILQELLVGLNYCVCTGTYRHIYKSCRFFLSLLHFLMCSMDILFIISDKNVSTYQPTFPILISVPIHIWRKDNRLTCGNLWNMTKLTQIEPHADYHYIYIFESILYSMISCDCRTGNRTLVFHCSLVEHLSPKMCWAQENK